MGSENNEFNILSTLTSIQLANWTVMFLFGLITFTYFIYILLAAKEVLKLKQLKLGKELQFMDYEPIFVKNRTIRFSITAVMLHSHSGSNHF